MRALVIIAGVGLTASAGADEAIHGRVAFQDAAAFARSDSIDAALGARDRDDASGDLRLIWAPTYDAWNVTVHYVLSAQAGPGVRLARTASPFSPPPPATWLNLTDTFTDHGDTRAQHRIDRLSLGYSSPDFVFRIGRQALTWGGGLVFRPMDLFDPFAPDATDTEYKPGVDMAYVQWLFHNGGDLQVIAAPRPDHQGGPPTSQASSFALFYRTRIAALETSVLLARDHGDWTGGLGLGGALGGAGWNVEIVPTAVDGRRVRVSGIVNISDARTFLGRNATVFGEYFHNGYGVDRPPDALVSLPPDLVDRLQRGQVFNLRQNYLAFGASVEWTPLLTLAPILIANLDDRSAYVLMSGSVSLADNLTLLFGAQSPLGSKGSEFGGAPVVAAGPLAAPPSRLYMQLRRYF